MPLVRFDRICSIPMERGSVRVASHNLSLVGPSFTASASNHLKIDVKASMKNKQLTNCLGQALTTRGQQTFVTGEHTLLWPGHQENPDGSRFQRNRV